ncbi:MAG: peroxiredoxin [Ignavibacterium sp.]|nr:peroxiredoxin [Ignavibacterium sp.]MDW8374067.1 peroxiredoxin [Ignavibacteriales bacterium]
MKKLIKLFFSIITFGLFGCGGNAQSIKEGELAPDFTLQDENSKSYTLSEFRGKSPVVIFFYPKAGTPGCTKQACGIRDNYDKFQKNGIVVFGISVDSKEAQKKFKDENNLNFPLLSDQDKKVSKAYDVLNNFGISSRVSFVIDKEGKIAHILRDINISQHADQVFELAMKLK